MIYRALGFLAVFWFSSSPTFSARPPPPITKQKRQIAGVRGGSWWGRSQIIRPQESLLSLNHSILYASAIHEKIDYLALSTFPSLSFVSVWTTRSVKWHENQCRKFSKSIWLFVIVQCNVGTVLLPHRCLLPSLYLLYQRFLLAWTFAARSFLSSVLLFWIVSFLQKAPPPPPPPPIDIILEEAHTFLLSSYFGPTLTPSPSPWSLQHFHPLLVLLLSV